MSRKLICHADVLVTMDLERREISDGAVLVENNIIKDIGTTKEIMEKIKNLHSIEIIDAKGCVVLPGMINCHHHLNEVTSRAFATGPGNELFQWLSILDPIWAQNTDEALYAGTKIGMCELLLSGCTTVADESFLPKTVKFDSQIRAANELGIRFHVMRGFIERDNVSEELQENEEQWLSDISRLIDTYHDAEDFSMTRIGVGPCTFFTNTKEGFSKAVKLARSHKNVLIHTHFQESPAETEICHQLYGYEPRDFMKEVGAVGKDCWYAHCVQLDEKDIEFFAETNTGVSYNASSNMILGSGISPILKLLDRGVRIGIGVDGSASSDSNNILLEARQAMLLQRVQQKADKMSARKALELATRGGASILNREDIGSIEIGKAADIIAYRVDGMEHAGATGDIVSSLLTCAPVRVWLSLINGKKIVENGNLNGVDIKDLVKRTNEASKEMLKRARAKM